MSRFRRCWPEQIDLHALETANKLPRAVDGPGSAASGPLDGDALIGGLLAAELAGVSFAGRLMAG